MTKTLLDTPPDESERRSWSRAALFSLPVYRAPIHPMGGFGIRVACGPVVGLGGYRLGRDKAIPPAEHKA